MVRNVREALVGLIEVNPLGVAVVLDTIIRFVRQLAKLAIAEEMWGL